MATIRSRTRPPCHGICCGTGGFAHVAELMIGSVDVPYWSNGPRRQADSAVERRFLDLYITHATNGINFTQLERQGLHRMRYEDREQPIREQVSAA